MPFRSGPVPPGNLERQFDEHTRAFKEMLDFLKSVIREDGALRNLQLSPEQFSPELFRAFSERMLQESEKLLDDVRFVAASAMNAAAEARDMLDTIKAHENAVRSFAASVLQETRERLEEQRQISNAQVLTPPLPTGALGPYSGTPGFYGADTLGAAATAQDYAQVSQDWAEHMPDPIPPNTLAINAITGQHWSSRWWAAKSAGAFGMMAWWYQGSWPQPGPPSTPNDPTGAPLPVGAMYYDTTLNTMMVWNGSAWENTFAPQAASTASLYYIATGPNQITFPLGTHDLNGASWAFNQTNPEGLLAMVNGVRLAPTLDFTVNIATSTVTFVRPVVAGALVIFDILVPKAQLAPTGTAYTYSLAPITPDGTTTVFNPVIASSGHPINTAKSEELLINIDGVQQQPGIAYTSYGNSVTFAQAPSADAGIWMIWFGPAGA